MNDPNAFDIDKYLADVRSSLPPQALKQHDINTLRTPLLDDGPDTPGIVKPAGGDPNYAETYDRLYLEPMRQREAHHKTDATQHLRTVIEDKPNGGMRIRVFFRRGGAVHSIDFAVDYSSSTQGLEPTHPTHTSSTSSDSSDSVSLDAHTQPDPNGASPLRDGDRRSVTMDAHADRQHDAAPIPNLDPIPDA